MELRKNTAVSQPFVIFSKISARNHERFQLKAGLSLSEDCSQVLGCDWVVLQTINRRRHYTNQISTHGK